MTMTMAKSTTGCPFCHPDPERVFYQGRTVFGLSDLFPVSPDHALLVTRREEIRKQALATFRAIRPEATLGSPDPRKTSEPDERLEAGTAISADRGPRSQGTGRTLGLESTNHPVVIALSASAIVILSVMGSSGDTRTPHVS
jgi:hypothetical protein